MFTLISPAKKLLSGYSPYTEFTSEPAFLKKTQELVRLMKKKSEADLVSLMDLSKDLAQLNLQRYKEFSTTNQEVATSYPAIYLFQGDVYQGLQAKSWQQPTLDFAQSHLGILSGLYGVLKPLDRIQPYRLEMGVGLENPKGKNLYAFWQKPITQALNELLAQQANPILINLASTEYFKAVDEKTLAHPVLTINFYEQKGNQLKMIGILSKKARGTMAKFIMEHQIDRVEGLKEFKELGYTFHLKTSSDRHLDFIRVS